MSEDDKKALRAEMRVIRRGMSVLEISELSARASRRILRTEAYRKAERVMLYAAKDAELSTYGLLRQVLADGKALYLPVVRGKGAMEAVRVSDLNSLKPGAFAVPEPSCGEAIGAEALDLIVVPGLAFDKAGGRLGYGGGYYDRFLPACHCEVIALCYERQLVDRVPTADTDFRVNRIATEANIYFCSEGTK